MQSILLTGAAVITSVSVIFGAVWYFVLPRLREQVTGKLDRVHDQVVNSHSTNLRDDLDALSEEVAQIRSAHQVTVAYQKSTREQLKLQLWESRQDSEKLDALQAQVSRVEGLLDGLMRGNWPPFP